MLRKWHTAVATSYLTEAKDQESLLNILHLKLPSADVDTVNRKPWKESHINESLEPGQRQELEKLFEDYPDVIQNTPGRTSVIEHDIDIGDSKSIRERPYRLPHRQNERRF